MRTNKKKDRKRTKGFVKEIFEYLNEIHKIEYTDKNSGRIKECLINLYILRNLVAHGNGRTKDSLHEKQKKWRAAEVGARAIGDLCF